MSRPEFSKRFVGIFKNLEGHEKELGFIEKELVDYCNPILDKLL